MTPTLLPCPFCGASAVLEHHSGDVDGRTCGPHITITCSNTGPDCVGPTCQTDTQAWSVGKGHYDITEEAVEELADLWNQRV